MLTSLVVFLSNAVLLVLQIMAGRLLSPYVGSSLATWTAVIGMFLAGISTGNWFGGRIADRAASGSTLRGILFAGGLCLFSVLGIVWLCGDGSLVRPIPLPLRIVTLSFVVCFPSAFVLSLITPIAIKLLLPDVRRTGRVVGSVYALGTLGSLVGNFVAGFYLSALVGTTAIVSGAGAVLMVLACLVPSTIRAIDSAHDANAPTTDPPVDAQNNLTLPVACAIVFFCSFGSMALELAASRLLAPIVGVSLYTWTGIIGVVLAGVVAGNYLGGRIADRRASRTTLGSSLFWAGLFTLSILVLFAIFRSFGTEFPNRPSGDSGEIVRNAKAWVTYGIGYCVAMVHHLVLPVRIVILSTLLFFLPMVAFGTISPQVTRLAVRDWAHAGRVAGRVYAWSCAGAIAGTFAAGWLLIDLFGVMRLILGVALALLVMSLPVGRLWSKPVEVLGCVLIVGASLAAMLFGYDRHLRFSPDAVYERESNYYLIRVLNEDNFEDDDSTVRQLCLDQLIHSHVRGQYTEKNGREVWEADVADLGYGHEQVQAEFARAVAGAHAQPQILLIGGGGYTLPRWIDRFVPQAVMEVVEIDPGVTEAVHVALNMPRDTRIKSHNLDGRQFVQELAQPGQYQLVIQDAVNDLSVPSHIMTLEYNRAVRRTLTDDGIFMLTVIDDFAATPGEPQGKLLPAAIRTMQESFPHVYLLGNEPLWKQDGRCVFIIAGMAKPFDAVRFGQLLAHQGVKSVKTKAMPDKEMTALLAATNPIVLTDDFVPTDNLLAEAFWRRK